MSITDQQPLADPSLTSEANQIWERRVDAARARLDRTAAAYSEALADVMALLAGKPAPSEAPRQIFATSVEVGDQVQWSDGWWYVTGTLQGDAAGEADAILLVTRIGYEPLELPFPGNTLLTVVRAEP